MSHHSSTPEGDRAAHELMRKIFGEFPDGKINKNDEGAIALQIFVENGTVVMKYPKPISWIGLTPEQAMDIAQVLIDRARSCGCTKQLAIRIGAPKEDSKS